MKIFISWSGDTSRRIGEAFRNWLPMVLQTVKPYYTPSDIDKGMRWSTDIAGELESSSAGIFCVTPENINSQWLMFEAGAISKQVGNSLVCPILFGMETSDLYGPLTQFQTTLFNKSDIRKLIFNLNKSNEGNVLVENILSHVFDQFWPDLEQQIHEILKASQENTPTQTKPRDERDLLEEILDITRALAIQKTGGFKAHDELNMLVSDFLASFSAVFGMDWEHTKICLEHGDMFIREYGSFITPMVADEENNWANRASLLRAYRTLIEYIETHKIDIRTNF
ncbi:hypothetical protein CRN80_21595 [Pseudomonas sp. FDAARGOS_380]|uniref:TIR domain-containing protein n=1 Tax=Pseudomonas sp. FDAARGOS_380 TaxID=2018067 RepID=UPI000BFE48F2|nr:TIR domain-containing protein [Pseudomonas sp. FDAARGOS_380]ATN12060.1 hypothetical protein CRN80_21595 [Pseudomonas sp. FDAARGOS_380]